MPAKKKPVQAPKRKMVQIHTVPSARGLFGWKVKVEGRVVGTETTQEKAESLGNFLARHMAPASVKYHARDGTIYNEATFDRKSDPRKTPG